MLAPHIKSITIAAIETLEKDAIYLENCCIELDEAYAKDSFMELKQVFF